MNEKEIKEVEKYLDDSGFKWVESIDSVDYNINGKDLVMGVDYALDDETNTKFNSLEEIKEFYNLYCMPEGIYTKKEHREYLKVIGVNVL